MSSRNSLNPFDDHAINRQRQANVHRPSMDYGAGNIYRPLMDEGADFNSALGFSTRDGTMSPHSAPSRRRKHTASPMQHAVVNGADSRAL